MEQKKKITLNFNYCFDTITAEEYSNVTAAVNESTHCKLCLKERQHRPSFLKMKMELIAAGKEIPAGSYLIIPICQKCKLDYSSDDSTKRYYISNLCYNFTNENKKMLRFWYFQNCPAEVFLIYKMKGAI